MRLQGRQTALLHRYIRAVAMVYLDDKGRARLRKARSVQFQKLWIAAGVCYESWQDAVRARQLQMIDPLSLIRHQEGLISSETMRRQWAEKTAEISSVEASYG